MPEYEERLAGALGNSDVAVVAVDDRLMLVYHPEGAETEKATEALIGEIMERMDPVMKTVPRGQRISRVILTDRAIPRTATGKIRREKLLEEVVL